MAREIPLTRGKVATVDDGDAEMVMRYQPWRASLLKGKWYAQAPSGKRGVKVLMHRLIMGEPAGKVVDHRDGNGLNNTRVNLRLASISQNRGNSVVGQKSRTGFKGVRRICSCVSRWQAQGPIGDQIGYLGLFASPEEAARAYDDAARLHYGEFACVNFPRPGERSALTGKIEPARRRAPVGEAELLDVTGE